MGQRYQDHCRQLRWHTIVNEHLTLEEKLVLDEAYCWSVHGAVEHGRYSLLEHLLEAHKQNPNSRNTLGQTPLHLAAVSEHKDKDKLCALLLQYKADPTLCDLEGKTPFGAIETVHSAENRLLEFQQLSTCPITLVIPKASFYENKQKIQALLQRYKIMNVRVFDTGVRFPSHASAQIHLAGTAEPSLFGSDNFQEASRQLTEILITETIIHPSNQLSLTGSMPLSEIYKWGKVQIKVRDKVKLLITQHQLRGKSANYLALSQLTKLQRQGLALLGRAYWNIVPAEGRYSDEKDCINTGLDEEEKHVIHCAKDWTPHIAASKGNVAIMTALLEEGLDPNDKDIHYKSTLLDKASCNRHYILCVLLLRQGASPAMMHDHEAIQKAFLQNRNGQRSERYPTSSNLNQMQGTTSASPARTQSRQTSTTASAPGWGVQDISRLEDLPQTNKAYQHFIGANGEEDQRLYKVWYSEKTIAYLLHSTAKTVATSFLPYVFLNQATLGCSFNEQFSELIVLRNLLQQDICFIATEPSTVHVPHFICGVLTAHTLLVINPIGSTKHHDFNRALQEIYERYQLTIYISETILQTESIGLVSCGPICVELVLHLLVQAKEEWANSLKKLVRSGKGKEQADAWLHRVDINPLLPPMLQGISQLPAGDYQQRLTQIRAAHSDRLIAMSTIIPHQTSEDTFWNRCENADVQVVMSQLCLEKKTIMEVQTAKAFQRLARQIATQLISPSKTGNTQATPRSVLSLAPIPAGISCQYAYASHIPQTDIVIEIERGVALPMEWDRLLTEKLTARDFSLSDFSREEEILIKSLIQSAPSAGINRSIQIDTLLENCSIKVKFVTPLKQSRDIGVTQLPKDRGKDKAKTKTLSPKTGKHSIITYEALQLSQMVKLEDETACPLLSALITRNQVAIAKAKRTCEKNPLLLTHQDTYGNNALHLASMQSDLTVLQLAVQNGLQLSTTNLFGMNALHFAVINGDPSTVGWLLQKNKHLSKSPLTLSIGKKVYSCSPLQLAVLFNQVKAFDSLLSFTESLYFDAHTTTELGNVLHAAILTNNLPILKHLLQKKEIIEKFLESVNADGQTPLALAALLGNSEVIKALCDAGADVNRSCQAGWRPLHYAVCGRKVGAVNTLFWQRANSQALAEDGTTPLVLAGKLEKRAKKKFKVDKAQWYSLVKGRLTTLINTTEGNHGLIDIKEGSGYKNLVIQGNSLGNLAYLGALEVLDEKGILTNLRRVASASNGAVIATLLALNFSLQQIGEIMSMEMTQCLDVDRLVIDSSQLKACSDKLCEDIKHMLQQGRPAARSQIQRLFNDLMAKRCVANGQFLAWLDAIIQQKLVQDGVSKQAAHYIKHFTFGKLNELINQGAYGYKHLHIVATAIIAFSIINRHYIRNAETNL